MVSLESVKVVAPENCNLILGQSHFIKTVEDVHEALVNAVPTIEFGLAFCESSGPCLVRVSGNNSELQEKVGQAAKQIGSGHSFLVFMRNAYPINVLDKVKSVPEVCSIFAATANPIEVIVAETEQGRGIMGVVDGSKPAGIESEKDIAGRKEFLRKIGYKQ
jgi:adenosine/AMP kinase